MSEVKAKKRSINVLMFLATFLIAVVVAALLIETIYFFKIRVTEGSDWIDVNTQYDSELGWANIPDSRRKNAWGTITHNAHGFRSETFNADKKQIVLLGDSVAWGYGVSDEQTIATQLQVQVPADTQVTNLGVSGFGLDQTYLWFERHFEKFKHLEAVVLILNAENDLIDVSSNTRYGKSKPLFSIIKGDIGVRERVRGRYSFRNLSSKSILLRKLATLHPKIKAFFDEIAGDKEISDTKTRQIATALMKRIQRLAAKKGARFYVLNAPSILDYNEGPIELEWGNQVIDEKKFRSIEVFGILPNHFDSINFAYYDDEHYSVAGSKWIATQIAKALNR